MRTLGFIAVRPRATIAAGAVKSAWSALFLIALLLGPFGVAGAAEYYGYDQGGSRFAQLAQITPAMSTNWSRPGPTTPAISIGAPRMC